VNQHDSFFGFDLCYYKGGRRTKNGQQGPTLFRLIGPKRNTTYLMLSEPECSCLLEMNSVYWDSVTYPSSRSMQTVKQIPTFS
jgi:hypothetical protein